MFPVNLTISCGIKPIELFAPAPVGSAESRPGQEAQPSNRTADKGKPWETEGRKAKDLSPAARHDNCGIGWPGCRSQLNDWLPMTDRQRIRRPALREKVDLHGPGGRQVCSFFEEVPRGNEGDEARISMPSAATPGGSTFPAGRLRENHRAGGKVPKVWKLRRN